MQSGYQKGRLNQAGWVMLTSLMLVLLLVWPLIMLQQHVLLQVDLQARQQVRLQNQMHNQNLLGVVDDSAGASHAEGQ